MSQFLSFPCSPAKNGKAVSRFARSPSPVTLQNHWISGARRSTCRLSMVGSLFLSYLLDSDIIVAGSRGALTATSNGGIDPASSVMHSFYRDHDNMFAPISPTGQTFCGSSGYPPCNNYYTHGLQRQYGNSSQFADFSALLGGSTLTRTPGYHLMCVSASDSDARNVMHEGAVVVRYQKIDTKGSLTCLAP